ncbi:MAG: carbon starvation CstA family protein [Bacteroidales bacterium]
MISFLLSIALLLLGYFVYGRFIDKHFGSTSKRITPAKRLADGVDYKEMSPFKIFIIQFLNIAGLGPIFGAILGAFYGPASYIWIVIGCIFMGAVHDYFSGMMSIRQDGKSIPDIIGKYLGKVSKKLMLLLSVFLLLAVGASFVTGPAGLIESLTRIDKSIWLFIIFAYYILATLLPIDKIIGNIYPYMGGFLLFMALGIAIAMIVKSAQGDIHMIELNLGNIKNFHFDSENNILIPMMFIVISCGAISGFHSTQSPLMARCMGDEKYGRPVFYGAMITEGIVALIWATAAMAFFNGPEGLNAAALNGEFGAPGEVNAAIIVNRICSSWLGKIGAIIAIIGVVVCPLSSGDTAFRSLRLIISDTFKISQKKIMNRVWVALPIFVIAFLLCTLNFSTIWKFVGICNQILASMILWTGAAYLTRIHKNHFYLSIPATFITFICICYLLIAPHNVGGLALDHTLSYTISITMAVINFIAFLIINRQIPGINQNKKRKTLK